MIREQRTIPFELRAATTDGSEFTGIGSAFHKIDDYGSIIAPGFFNETLEFFLAKGFIGGLNHDWSAPIGKPTAASIDGVGLLVSGKISDTTNGRDVKVLLKDGVITQLSMGFTTQGYEWLNTQADVEGYWEQHNYTPDAEDVARSRYGAMLKTRGTLYEVSPVTVPGNSACTITDVRASNVGEHLNALLGANDELLARIKTGSVTSEQRSQLMQLRGRCDQLLGLESETKTEIAVAVSRLAGAELAQFEADWLALGGRF